jgi:hypothetical protein
MHPASALAQDKSVLRPNGNDQVQAQKQALGKDRPSLYNTFFTPM